LQTDQTLYLNLVTLLYVKNHIDASNMLGKKSLEKGNKRLEESFNDKKKHLLRHLTAN